MKLRFDENLSRRLVRALADVVPESAHVELVGLAGHADRDVWAHARAHGFVILSKDNDFRQVAALQAPPPKVVWLSVGNAGTSAIAAFIRARIPEIRRFADDSEESLLVLEMPAPERRESRRPR